MNSITANVTTIDVEPTAIRVWVDNRTIFIELTDGRIIGFLADRFRILKNATHEQLKEVTLQFRWLCFTLGQFG